MIWSYLICLSAILCQCRHVTMSKLNEYVNYYELADVDVSPSNVEFLINYHAPSNVYHPEDIIRIRLNSFGQEFDFLAFRSQDASLPTMKMTRLTGDAIVPGGIPFYEKNGDCDLCLRAFGYLSSGVFTGFIKSEDTTFYIEPALHYFRNVTGKANVVVYRDEDLIYPVIDNAKEDSTKDPSPSIEEIHAQSYDRSKLPEIGCDVELVADHTLFQFFDGNVGDTTAFLYLHGKYADEVFRRSNFGDKTVRIIVKDTEVYTSSDAASYPFHRSFYDFNDYLMSYTFRVQDFCVSMIVCDRAFSGEAIGISFKADQENIMVGGICQKPVRELGRKRSYNTGAITLRNSDWKRLSLGVTLRSFVHELGHSFGSSHDDLNNFLCSPGGDLGFYLMHSKSQNQPKFFSSSFSPCSLNQMSRLIDTRPFCLRSVKATCGNGIREGDEECDCGDARICDQIDRCCTPKKGIGNDTGCTFRRSSGSLCSPKENTCCTDNCNYVPAYEKKECYMEKDTCQISFCDGNQHCPPPKNVEDGTVCKGTSKTCHRGACNSTICLDHNYENCLCDSKTWACHVCCKQSDGVCRAALHYNFKTPQGHTHLLHYGTSCHKSHQCNLNGECVKGRKIEDKNISQWPYIYHVLSLLLFAAIVALLVFLIYRRLHRNVRPAAPREPELYVISPSYRHPSQIGGISVHPKISPTIDVPITTRY